MKKPSERIGELIIKHQKERSSGLSPDFVDWVEAIIEYLDEKEGEEVVLSNGKEKKPEKKQQIKFLPDSNLPYGTLDRVLDTGDQETYKAHPQTINAITEAVKVSEKYGLTIEKLNEIIGLIQKKKIVVK